MGAPVPADDLPNAVPEHDLPASAAPTIAPEKPPVMMDVLRGLLTGGPLGAAVAGTGRGLDTINDVVMKGAYKAGGAVTDLGTKAGLSPEWAAGAGLATNVGLQAIPAVAGGGIGRTAAPLLESAGQRLMQSAIKPGVEAMKSGAGPRAVQTMLDEGINATKGGVEKLNTMISNLGDDITNVLKRYSGTTVDKGAVASRIQDAIKRVESTNPTPQSALRDINKVYDDFLTNGLLPQNIPIQEANKLKMGIYRTLREQKAYGQISNDTNEAQKALGRGFKEEINAAAPEVVPLNARQGELLNAKKLAERRTFTEGNTNIMGLAPLTHSPGAAAAFLLDKYGLSKSLLARLLYSGSEPIATGAGAGAGSLTDLLTQRNAP